MSPWGVSLPARRVCALRLSWLVPASPWPGVLLGCLLVYGLRLACSAGSGASLHVDEAQYWDWSRHLQWGYYSKPPAIAALIATSSALFGDGETGLRALAMACYPLTALVLAWLALDMAAPSARQNGARAAGWAAAVFLASPLAALLGLVATTDAPLLLCWALALAGLWWALERRRPGGWWLFAVAAGLGLLSKYTLAALLAGALLLVLVRHRQRPHLVALVLAAAGALLLFAPHLVWNAQAGWPTVRHTAEITVGLEGRLGGGWLDLAAFAAAQGLLFAPLALPGWLLLRGRAARPLPTLGASPAGPFLLWTSLPLLLLGAWQAWRSGAQVNWVAPAHLAATLAWALALAGHAQAVQRRVAGLLVLQTALWAVLAVAPHAAASLGRSWPALVDPWARMRGWPEALDRVAAIAPRPALLVGTSRTVMAQAAYHWRRQDLPRAVWAAGPKPGHHYEMHCPWRPATAAAVPGLLVLADGPLPDGLLARTGPLQPLAVVPLARTPRRQLALQLWQASGPPDPSAAPPGGALCR